MSDDPSVDPADVLGLASVDEASFEDIEDVGRDEDADSDNDGEITIAVFCPSCGDPMSVNTVVSQEDVKRNGRMRYEAVCTDCQTAVIITLVKTVGDYNDIFGFDSPEIDWDTEDLGDSEA